MKADFCALGNLLASYLDQGPQSVFGTYLASEIMNPKRNLYYFTIAKFMRDSAPYSIAVFTFDGKKVGMFIDKVKTKTDSRKMKGLVSLLEGTPYSNLISNFKTLKKDVSKLAGPRPSGKKR